MVVTTTTVSAPLAAYTLNVPGFPVGDVYVMGTTPPGNAATLAGALTITAMPRPEVAGGLLAASEYALPAS